MTDRPKRILGAESALIMLLLAACSALTSFLGCQSNSRELAEGGVYAGDKILYGAEAAIVEADDAMGAFLAFADRNPGYVRASERLSGLVEEVRSNRDEWIREAITARNIYEESRSIGDASTLSSRLTLLRSILLRIAAMSAVQDPDVSPRTETPSNAN